MPGRLFVNFFFKGFSTKICNLCCVCFISTRFGWVKRCGNMSSPNIFHTQLCWPFFMYFALKKFAFSSYHINQSALRGSTGCTREKNGYSCVNTHRLHKNFEANMPACRCVVQDCSNKSDPQTGISLYTPKSNYELAKWKSFVRTHSSNFNPKGLFKICSVHFSSDCFERTVHIGGAPRRLITGSIPTIWKASVKSTTSAISPRSRRRVSK